MQVLQSGANLNNGSQAGLSAWNGNNDSSNSNWNICGHICLNIFLFMTLPLGKRKNKNLTVLVEKSKAQELQKREKMKRYGNLFAKITHKQNILTAHKNARKGKKRYAEVRKFDNELTKSIDDIHNLLKDKKYKVSPYRIDTRIERGKERIIFKLPYRYDRVIHHTLLQVVEPILSEVYIKDTYQSIKGRGVHKAKKRVLEFLKDKENTKYCLKIDIRKFYPSVDNGILKSLIRRKIKCNDTLWLCDEIIDSTKGLPIGNHTSQTFGNYYLAFFDHFVKEDLRVKYYVRYADDMVFFSSSKEELHNIKSKVEEYLKTNLKLELKSNYQIFPTDTRGVDFLGFRFFHYFTILRKSIKKGYLKIVKTFKNGGARIKTLQSLMSYWGWLKATDSYNLQRTTLTKFVLEKISKLSKMVGIKNPLKNFYIVPKVNTNQYGNYQPTLFDFIK